MHSTKQHELTRLATATTPIEAHIWQQALEEEGIRCQVVGDYLDAGIGNICTRPRRSRTLTLIRWC